MYSVNCHCVASYNNLRYLSYILVSVCQLLPIAVLHRLLSSRSRETQGGENSCYFSRKLSLYGRKETKTRRLSPYAFSFQQLAALLIARQVIGNLKESAIPYLVEQLRLARLSFELFGALSPSEARPPPGQERDELQDGKDKEEEKEERPDSGKAKQPRNVSQAELESSLYRVGHPTNSLLSDVTFKVWSRFSQ